MLTIRRASPGIALTLAWLLCAGFAAAQTSETSTEKDQKDLAVTVYNSNVGLVRDVRRVTLPAGTVDLRFMDIAASVTSARVGGVRRLLNVCSRVPWRNTSSQSRSRL